MYKQTYQGRYPVANPSKYRGDSTNVIYRSLWELKFMKYCDNNPNVLSWGSEEVVIPYLSPVDGKIHRYFVDFYMEVKDATGKVTHYLIEIKPARFTQPPVNPGRKTKGYIQEVMQYGVNQAKWKSAEQVCKKRGWKFEILTERELGIDK